MSEITVVHNPDKNELEAMGVFDWPIWEKEPSSFPWTYGDKEVCYLLEGDVTVTAESGEVATFGAGDLVTFPAGMSCHWDIRVGVRKHYRFG